MSIGSGLLKRRAAPTAASALLERVIGEERDRLTMSFCRARVVIAAVNFLFVFPQSGSAEEIGYSSVAPSRYGALAYLVMSALVVAAVTRWPKLLRPAAFSPAFIDVPLVGTSELLQVQYALTPGHGTQASVAYLLVLSLLSMLSLSRTVVLVSAVPTLGFLLAILVAARVPMEITVGTAIAVCGAFVLGWIVVSRMRALVQASRQNDLLGKYILGERLGAGGMAEVFLATYSPEGGFERRVALKRMLPAFSSNHELLTLFRREAAVGARLTHPNIVQVFDFGVHDDRYFLAMEYVDGQPLSRLLRHLASVGVHLPTPALLYLAHEVGAALEYVATVVDEGGTPLRLVHRDLNPPNILIARSGAVKVADFGIARAGNQPGITETGVMRGKVAYAAPEQLTSQPLDARADLFALWLTLLEASSNERVFQAPSELELVRAALEGAIPTLHERRPDAPAGLAAAIAGLVTRPLEARTATAREFLLRIEADVRAHDALEAGRAALATIVAATPSAAPQLALPDQQGELETKTTPR